MAPDRVRRGSTDSVFSREAIVQSRIDYARRQALEARDKAHHSLNNSARSEWEKAAQMWEQLIVQYELLRSMEENAASDAVP